MAGKFSNTSPPAQGYTETASQSRGITDPSGRGADDDTVTGRKTSYGADPDNRPPLSAAGEAGSVSTDADMESDEAPSGRVQGG